MRREIPIGLALAVITLVAFWPIGRLGFINYDDNFYVTKNPHVQAGITVEGIRWAFTAVDAGNWHPVTWLSHMLDCQLFGLKASGPHWVNLGFHIANTLLLYVVLRQMTQAVWRSVLVAALFALHPTHVQSVAWVSERKDVLSALFFMLTLLMYARYAAPSLAQGPKSKVFHGLALMFFALGLMSKPMLVTLPVILLLLDFWPLKRFTIYDLRFTIWPLIREKAPFVVLSLASCVITLQAQKAAKYIASADQLLPWYWRVANSLVFYTDYLGKIFWPVNLAIFYPYTPRHLWDYICSALLPVMLTLFYLRRVRSQSYLPVGWFWFVLMLVPVIGLVTVGMQAIADRYTYLPSIGLFIIVAWGMAGIAAMATLWRTVMTLGAAGLVLACLLDTRNQLDYWQDNIKLFSHAIETTRENNFEGYFLLGYAYMESGNLNAAGRCYESALKINPYFEDARLKLAEVLFLQTNYEAAVAQVGEVLQLNPNNAEARECLGFALAAQNKITEAVSEYTTALQLKPDDVTIREALAQVLVQKGEPEKALACLQEALKIQPTPGVHAQVAAIRARQAEFPDASRHYRAALRLRPDTPEILNNLAWLLATCPDMRVRDGTQAVGLAERACKLTQYQQTIMVGTLAAAYAESGRFDEAISMAEKACALATKSGELDLLKRNQELLALYQKHQPYHEPLEKLVPAAP